MTTQSVAAAELPADPALSKRAIAAFVTAPPVEWNGTAHVLFARGQALQLKVQLVVAEPAPKAPLPKAIVRVVVKDPASQTVLAEKVVKQRDVAANATVTVPFSAAELAEVPVREADLAARGDPLADAKRRGAQGSRLARGGRRRPLLRQAASGARRAKSAS